MFTQKNPARPILGRFWSKKPHGSTNHQARQPNCQPSWIKLITFPARITRVGFGSTITDNVVTYLTYLDVDNADLSLRPGMTATATITATQRVDVLLVPNTSLRFTPAAAASPTASKGVMASLTPRMPGNNTRRSAAAGASTALAKQVWVLPKDGVPVAVAVTPGISDGRMTEITGGDLVAGMLVITDQKTATTK
jgi:HlyD family secretion protein